MADDTYGTNGSSGVIFTNVRVLDGSGEYPYTGEVTVQGNRIRHVTKGSSRLTGGGGAGRQHGLARQVHALMARLCDAPPHRSSATAPRLEPSHMPPPA